MTSRMLKMHSFGQFYNPDLFTAVSTGFVAFPWRTLTNYGRILGSKVATASQSILPSVLTPSAPGVEHPRKVLMVIQLLAHGRASMDDLTILPQTINEPPPAASGSWHPAWRPEKDDQLPPAEHVTNSNGHQGVAEDRDLELRDLETNVKTQESNVEPRMPPDVHLQLQSVTNSSTGILNLRHELQSEENDSPVGQNNVKDNNVELGEGTETEEQPPNNGREEKSLPLPLSRSPVEVGSHDAIPEKKFPTNLQEEADAFPPYTVTRAPSFPEVPPLEPAESTVEIHQFPHTQAEEILESIEDGEESEDVVPYNTYIPDSSSHDPFDQVSMGQTYDFYNHLNGDKQDHSALEVEQADFEEPLPLVSSEEERLQKSASPAELSLDDAFGDSALEDDFYAQVLETKSKFDDALETSDNRSTNSSQELDTLQGRSQRSSEEILPQGDLRPSLEDLTGGGIAVSTSTVISQVAAEGLDKPSTLTEDFSAQPDLMEEDLAAKWRAALGDDDLLDDESGVDPSAFFEDDGEGFLEDEIDAMDSTTFSPPSLQPVKGSDGQLQGFDNISTQSLQPTQRGIQQNRYAPSQVPNGLNTLQQQSSSYATNGQSRLNGPSPVSRPGSGPQANTQIFPSGSIAPVVNKSPYDLPFDVTRPKKRPERLQEFAPAPPQPPPRTSSMSNASGSPGISNPQLSSSSQTVRAKPSTSSFFEELPVTAKRPSVVQRSFTHNATPPAAPTPPPQLRPKASTSSFFEDLAPASKPRPSGNLSRTPSFAPNLLSPPTSHPLPQAPTQQPSQTNPAQFPLANSSMPSLPPESQLLPPQRMPLFESQSTSPLPPQTAPAIQSRYSPAPPPTTQSANRNRYAASTVPPRPSSVSTSMPFQPRTSSPLARSASTSNQESVSLDDDHSSKIQQGPPLTGPPRPSFRSAQTSQYPPSPRINSVFASDDRDQSARRLSRSVDEPESLGVARAYHHPLEQTYAPTPEPSISEVHGFNPPPRSRTSSPNSSSQQHKAPLLDYATISRSASINDLKGFARNSQPAQYTPSTSLPPSRPSHITPQNDLIVPTDGREHDPLQRWKGAPIFTFGLGGNTVSSFPKHVPMFTTGSVKASTKCLPGEVKLDVSRGPELDERTASFPGPLRSKSKKKEVLEWLQKAIDQLSQQMTSLSLSQVPAEIRKRHGEKILLWKILRVMVDSDGSLEGSAPAIKAVQAILSHQDVNQEASQPLHRLPNESSAFQKSIFRSTASRENPRTEDPGALESLHKLLLQGEREKAVWLAVDQHLWGHAMLICSTLSNEIWKQIIQEFVRQELRAHNENAESMAALYAIFAGNWEESVDQLVPPSARAGFQMISKTAGSGSTKNALDGLDQWQETLALILSNRTSEDQKAIAALGRLLMTYGRIEAAHICFLFSRSQLVFSGADEAQMGVVLLGADHTHQPFDFGRDADGILLTEVYEFATTVLAPSPSLTALPHLQSFKLQHAILLAEGGQRDKAMSYCDALQSIMKSTTKPSPYYHKYFFSQLNDFNDRLRQVPKESSASWIARPSMEGVSGSVWNKFTKFVQGDDSDAVSTGSGNGLDGDPKPFAGVTDTPIISRDPSPNSSYGSYPNGSAFGPGLYAPIKTNSKYAPSATHTPLSIPDQSLQVNQTRLDVRPSSNEPSRQGPLRKQPSYASMPNISPDFNRKPHNEAYQPAPSSANPYSSATLPRPGSSSSTPSRGAFNPYAPNPSPLPPSQLQHAFHLDASPSIDEQVSSQVSSPPTAQYTSALFDQSGLQRSFSGDSQMSPTTVPPAPSQYVTSPEPAHASLANQGPSSEMYNHLQESPQVPVPSFGYEPPTGNSYGPETNSYEAPEASSYEPPKTSYDPTTSYDPGLSSYEPPADSSHVNGEDSPVETKPKRSFMDDDDETDLAAQATALKAQDKARKDREADEAFRKAAEADGRSLLTLQPQRNL